MARGSLGFGIVRSVDATLGRARLAELCSVLTEEMGTLFVPHHPETYAELTSRCQSGELAIAWVPPVACSKLEATGSAKVLALPVRRGAVAYRAALVAREGGPNTLADVQGASIAWVDRESCSGYIVPRLFLSASFELRGLFSEERFVGSHAAVVEAVASRRVDVGATFCPLDVPTAMERTSLAPPVASAEEAARAARTSIASFPRGGADAKRPLRVLASTGPIPNDGVVASEKMPAEIRSRLLRWFLDARSPRAKKLCGDLFGAESFRVASHEHFAPLRQIIQAARIKG